MGKLYCMIEACILHHSTNGVQGNQFWREICIHVQTSGVQETGLLRAYQATNVPSPPSFLGHQCTFATLLPGPPMYLRHPPSQATNVPSPPSFPGRQCIFATLLPRPPMYLRHPPSRATNVPSPPSSAFQSCNIFVIKEQPG